MLNILSSRLTAERDKVADVIRLEFAEKLAAAEAENTRMAREHVDNSSNKQPHSCFWSICFCLDFEHAVLTTLSKRW
jgi:hypothetical protein